MGDMYGWEGRASGVRGRLEDSVEVEEDEMYISSVGGRVGVTRTSCVGGASCGGKGESMMGEGVSK